MVNCMDIKEIITRLCAADGVSGAEKDAADAASSILGAFSDKISKSPLGDVIAEVIAPAQCKKHFLLDAHIDSIGLVVKAIDEKGFLHVDAVGGVDVRTLPSARVTVNGKRSLPGFVCITPPHLQKSSEGSAVDIEKIYIDIGLSKEKAEQLVSCGDVITLSLSPVELLNNCLAGSFLDDRAGCAAVIKAAEMIQERKPHCGLSVVLSTREETGGQGAAVSSYKVAPTHAVAVDVSFGTSPGCDADKCSDLGSGVMIGFSPCLCREMSQQLVKTADKYGIPYTCEVSGGKTYTNADDIAVSRSGVKTALLSIPLKYMHMPVETVCVDDVQAVAKLICEYVCQEAEND